MTSNDAVRAAFVAWASRRRGAPRDTASLVYEVTVSHDHVGLLATEIQGRRVVWKDISASSRTRVTVPSLTPETIDPWSVDPASLRERSEHIAICDACNGEKKVHCSVCGGIGKQICGTCGGQRKMYGYAANGSRRLLNCNICRGKGELDCDHCRRGIATCGTCGGEGRLQRWIQLEWWRRSVTATQPQVIARQCRWPENPANEGITRDADLVADVDRPHRLTSADLGNLPARWLELLAPPLQPGERIARQRLRIARLDAFTVRYRLGDDEDRVTFTGRQLAPPAAAVPDAFARRASNLRSLRMLLLTTAVVVAVISLARGTFYWSLPTMLSLVVFGGALGAAYATAAEWTAARRRVRHWLLASVAAFLVASALAVAALPRVSHAQRLIAAGSLDRAESELRALVDRAPAHVWADLRVARVAGASDIDQARTVLEQIPREMPQYAVASVAFDALVLRLVDRNVRAHLLAPAAKTLALLSESSRGKPEAIAAAASVYIPLARRSITNREWSDAADAIASARRFGVAAQELEPLTDPIRDAADALMRTAARETGAENRLHRRLEAEAVLVSWERAAGHWGTPALIALRSAAARDLAAAEKAARRRRR